MKKFKTIMLFAFLLCPILFLTACVSPSTYLITTSSSESSWGRVSGGTTEKRDEGSKINLTAVENNSQDHPFICWVKDYKTVYSTKKSIELVYNQENQGHYTAVYEEDANKMLFASFYGIHVVTSNYQSGEYSIKSSSSESGTNNYSTFCSGSFQTGQNMISDNSAIFYFGPLGRVVEYKFEVELTLTNASSQQTTQNIKFTSKINNASFTNDGNCEIMEIYGDSNIIVSLSFKKLAFNTYHTGF